MQRMSNEKTRLGVFTESYDPFWKSISVIVSSSSTEEIKLGVYFTLTFVRK